MSAGSPIVKARIPRELLDQLYTAITEYNWRHPARRTSVSAFIVKAIREKLAHADRSAKSKKGRGDDTAEVVNLVTGVLRDTHTGQEYQCPTK